jgi:cytochrome b subunit of formate dehydrogenase
MTTNPLLPKFRIRRFDTFDRALHVGLMVSFLSLSLSGLPLIFASSGWARTLAGLMGGYGGSRIVHRVAATLLIACFLAHLGRIAYRVLVRRERGLLWGPNSFVPRPQDAIDMFGHFRWFISSSPRPRFGRFTYWEKFDYWAVFWGMGIIGFSGFMMWWPGLFASWMPGWMFNVALLIHGEEALLAMLFIFTVHFFNGHLRPEKFPMDTVIFTGNVPLEELKHERPDEYERLVADDALKPAEPAPRWVAVGGRTIGTIAVILGWIMVILTIRGLMD